MLHDELKKFRLILASNSPRRSFLMREAGFEFDLSVPQHFNEEYPSETRPEDVPAYLARIKAAFFESKLKENEIVITADTVVILNNYVLGKPIDFPEAFNMLRSISGNKHKVITAVCLKSKNKEHVFSAKSEVWFRHLSDQEIEFYINEYKPYDKAGAYGVQEWIGYIGVEKINGSFFNVMGLPVQMLYVELEKFIE